MSCGSKDILENAPCLMEKLGAGEITQDKKRQSHFFPKPDWAPVPMVVLLTLPTTILSKN